MRRHILAFVLAFACSVNASVFAWAVSKGWSHIWWGVLADLATPFVSVLAVVWMVEAKSWQRRLALCWITGFGYALGTVVVLWSTK